VSSDEDSESEDLKVDPRTWRSARVTERIAKERRQNEQEREAQRQERMVQQELEKQARLADEGRLRALPAASIVHAVSDFSGICALEHGLQAGMETVGLSFSLLQASELLGTSSGDHNASVIRARFPYCHVLDATQRISEPLPDDAIMASCTAFCTEHSSLKSDRSPLTTEAAIEPFIYKLRAATNVRLFIFENVVDFLRKIGGQTRSSYAVLLKGLESVGFDEHAYALLNSGASGDHHHRTRLISVHTRPGSFSPAAALTRLLDEPNTSEPTIDEPNTKQTVHQDDSVGGATEAVTEARTDKYTNSAEPLTFILGRSVGRWKQGHASMQAVAGRLPAYNTSLQVGIFHEGTYYEMSDVLAQHASSLHEDYQREADHSGRRGRSQACTTTNLKIALANMVSPLMARELGAVLGSEWLQPRTARSLHVLRAAPSLRCDLDECGFPKSFPSSKAAVGKPATLVFNDRATGRWHQIAGREWHSTPPPVPLSELCREAVQREELRPLGIGKRVELLRLSADVSLTDHQRACARRQLDSLQLRTVSTWVECTLCQKWRRVMATTSALDEWRCDMNSEAVYASCEMAEEPMDAEERVLKPRKPKRESWQKKRKRQEEDSQRRLEAKIESEVRKTLNGVIAKVQREERDFTAVKSTMNSMIAKLEREAKLTSHPSQARRNPRPSLAIPPPHPHPEPKSLLRPSPPLQPFAFEPDLLPRAPVASFVPRPSLSPSGTWTPMDAVSSPPWTLLQVTPPPWVMQRDFPFASAPARPCIPYRGQGMFHSPPQLASMIWDALEEEGRKQ